MDNFCSWRHGRCTGARGGEIYAACVSTGGGIYLGA